MSPEAGIVMEPATLAFHYDDVYYQPICIKIINPAVDNKALQEMINSLCTLGPIGLNVSVALALLNLCLPILYSIFQFSYK